MCRGTRAIDALYLHSYVGVWRDSIVPMRLRHRRYSLRVNVGNLLLAVRDLLGQVEHFVERVLTFASLFHDFAGQNTIAGERVDEYACNYVLAQSACIHHA